MSAKVGTRWVLAGAPMPFFGSAVLEICETDQPITLSVFLYQVVLLYTEIIAVLDYRGFERGNGLGKMCDVEKISVLWYFVELIE